MVISYLMIILAKSLITAAFTNNNSNDNLAIDILRSNLNLGSNRTISNYINISSFKPCPTSFFLDCCNDVVVCSSNCNSYCPCQCLNQKNVVSQTNFSPTSSIKPSQSILSTEVSFSAYTLILSIGLPSVSIILIICTLLTITYCCKSRSSSDGSNFNNDVPISVSNLSLVYINLDENNNNNNNLPKEPPPKYSEYIKSSIVDKLPSYRSFRTKATSPLPSPSPVVPVVSQTSNTNTNNNTHSDPAALASSSAAVAVGDTINNTV